MVWGKRGWKELVWCILFVTKRGWKHICISIRSSEGVSGGSEVQEERVEGWLLKKWCGCRTLGHSHPHLVERCVLIPGPAIVGIVVAFEAVPLSSNTPVVRATLIKSKKESSKIRRAPGERVWSPREDTRYVRTTPCIHWSSSPQSSQRESRPMPRPPRNCCWS